MSDEAALLRAISDAPADDAVRLVYSDWLEDRGDLPRAEFIRAQVRRATLRPWHADHDELVHRENTLLRQHAKDWVAPVRPWLHRAFDIALDVPDDGTFRRGFVETALVDPKKFLADPEGLFAAVPLTGVVFWIRSPMLAKVLGSPTLGRLERLQFLGSENRVCRPRDAHIHLSAGDFRRIAECPHLERLRELEFNAQTIPADEVTALVRSRWLLNLETLKVAHSGIDAEGFEAIGTHLALPALRHLHLNNNYHSARLRTWQGRPWLRQLRTLDLSACGITVGATAAFLSSSPWPELEVLQLGSLEEDGPTTPALGRALSRMPRLAHLDLQPRFFPDLVRAFKGAQLGALESLNLCGSFAEVDATRLFSAAAFPSLRVLNLSGNKLTDGLPAFAHTPTAAALRWLGVSNCGATLDDIETFARARLPDLQYLYLGEDKLPFPPRTVRLLGEATGFPRLSSLTLALPGDQKVYQALAEMPLLRQLRHLRIYGGTIGPKVVAILTSAPGFQGLATLEFWTSTINVANRRRLKKHFGARLVD
jgi:uncharacterized protein (TIGR02996 family)